MKICFISHSSGLRGAELALLEAIKALITKNVTPVVFVPEKGPLANRLQAMKVDYYLYSAIPWVTTRHKLWRSIGKSFLAVLYTLQLAIKLRKQHCQLIYSNSIAIAMGAWAAAIIRVPHVWHLHEFGYEDHGFKYDLGNGFAQWVLRKLGGFFIVNSHAVANKFSCFLGASVFLKRHKVIYQAVTLPLIEPSFRKPVFHSEIILLIVGALHANKGQADAISATYKLHKLGIKASLLLVGEGEDKYLFEQMADDLEILQDVHFIGTVENVSNWYALSDIVLVCSKMEAFGRVAVEAMLSGKPVVAANAGGLTEIIEHGVTGLQYEYGNIDDLITQIESLRNDKEKVRELTCNASNWVNGRFTQERYGRELYKILHALTLQE